MQIKVLKFSKFRSQVMFCMYQLLSMLLNVLVDVFGKNSQPSTSVEASDITDLIDFL